MSESRRDAERCPHGKTLDQHCMECERYWQGLGKAESRRDAEAERWRLTYDDDQQEDEYADRPSEFLIRQTQSACPDAPVRLWRLRHGWNAELVEERPALDV